MKMRIAKMPNNEPEIYPTIQGEGVTIGLPSIFVRASGCNLHCVWCDTYYTWNWEKTKFNKEHLTAPKVKFEDYQMEMHVADIVEYVLKWPKIRNIIFTGGEPLIQQQGFYEVGSRLKNLGGLAGKEYRIEVETNATIFPNHDFDVLVDQYNTSPKLESSGNELYLRRTKAFKWYTENPKAWFKFVICTPQDLEEVNQIAEEYKIHDRIILMPEGITPEKLHEKSVWLAPLAMQYGYRFTPRLQVELWGSKRAI